MNEYDFFIFAGEPSGDLHGEALLKNLYRLKKNAKIFSVAGPKMRSTNVESILPMEEFSVMGFVDVFLALPKIRRNFYYLARQILEKNPKTVVFIDYPGFALRQERYLKKKGFKGKIAHYICPSVWAHGKRRIPLMEKNLDLLLTIFPFEKKYFSPSLPVEYVGHPLVTRIKNHTLTSLEFPKEKKIISLFPGSRKKEISLNFPTQLKALKALLEINPDLIGAISLSSDKFLPLLKNYITKEALSTKVHFVAAENTYDLMASSFLALAKSGTVTLELALYKVPTVVTYGIKPLDLFIAKDLLRIRLPFYCIVNIIAEKEIFKELIGPYVTEENLIKEAKRLFLDEAYREEKKALCETVALSLGETDASKKAATILLA